MKSVDYYISLSTVALTAAFFYLTFDYGSEHPYFIIYHTAAILFISLFSISIYRLKVSFFNLVKQHRINYLNKIVKDPESEETYVDPNNYSNIVNVFRTLTTSKSCRVYFTDSSGKLDYLPKTQFLNKYQKVYFTYGKFFHNELLWVAYEYSGSSYKLKYYHADSECTAAMILRQLSLDEDENNRPRVLRLLLSKDGNNFIDIDSKEEYNFYHIILNQIG